MERKTFFAEVVLPLPIQGYFTYRIPHSFVDEMAVGIRVVVQFGKKKIYTALVKSIHENIPQDYTPKYILAILDSSPITHPVQFEFWEWMASYYMCSVGEVMNAALPSALKLGSETSLVLNPDYIGDPDSLTEREFLIYEAVQIQQKITLSDVSKIVDLIKIYPLIRTLIEKGVVLQEEELNDPFRPKITEFIQFSEAYFDDKNLEEAINTLEKKAHKQLEIVLSLIQLSKRFTKNPASVKKKDLLAKSGASSPQLKSLVEKGIIVIEKKVISRLPEYNSSSKIADIIFSEAQETAYTQLKESLCDKTVSLLHGVTGSGKTELYIKAISETIEQGKQVLYLLPEIALTTQIITRLRRYFGNKVGIYHSRYNMHERAEVWHRVNKEASKSYQIVLGARSALFLPFYDLGLIIIDEEHDYSFKQFNPAPRYNARDAAIWLAHKHGAKVILGSATPCIETYYNARSGKYGLVELNERFGGLELPEVQVADLKTAHKRKEMHTHFSDFLLKHIDEALKNKEQIILFQNRRGFSLRLECEACGWIPQCISCDVSLTYHKHFNQLRCHYCGYNKKVPTHCPECGSAKVTMKGFGTEKIEEDLSILYPNHRIERMDLDTTRSKNAYQRIIHDFENQHIDILVGTQMVTKGLDFDNVSLVGVLSADSMINFPDFRSFERSYQLMAQVSGRAGRKKKQGKVVIQTFNPFHDAIRYVMDNNYQAMYQSQILERKNFHYPPFYRLINISLRHRDPVILNKAADVLAVDLRHHFGNSILGPEYPLVSRVKNLFIKQIMVKMQRGQQFSQMRITLQNSLYAFEGLQEYKSIRISIDVDPY